MLRVLTLLPFILLSACASQREWDSASEVQQSTSRHRLANDHSTREVVYLRVASDSPEAVLYAEPDKWSEIVAQLEFGERLVVVGYNRKGYLLVQSLSDGFEVEGWLWALAAQSRMPRGMEDAVEFQTRGAELESGRPPHPSAIQDLDEHENALAAMGASAQLQSRFREFGTSGGLKDD